MWDVVIRRSLEPVLDSLKGKKAGWGETYRKLQEDPCQVYPTQNGERPFAYRLTGELQPRVCGAPMKNGYRVAFTMRPSDRPGIEGIVEVLLIGTRNTRDRSLDFWDILHALFNVQNPKTDHLRPPCCDQDRPEMDEQEIGEFMRNLRRLSRAK